MDGSQLLQSPEPVELPDLAAPTKAKRVRWSRRQILAGTCALIALAGAGEYGHYYWKTGRFLVSTDDATIQADSVIISPKVPGYVSAVLVQDNQSVRAGQVLARIDDADYRTALAAAQASLAADQATVQGLQNQIGEQQATVVQARATVAADQASQTFAQQQYSRYATLAQNGAGTVLNAQQWQAGILEEKAKLARDVAGVTVATKQINVLGSALANARALVAEQTAAVRQAGLNLGYTTIISPNDGVVGDRTLRVGQYVQAGTQLLAIVPLSAIYVTANYEETQLTDAKPGQKVSIEVDTFPGETVHGVVNSIAPASGEEFALLPPDNATGNYTKIVQRIPVKIAIDPHDPLLGRLRPGMSVEPTIDTRASEG
jgi:membrane fusion protein, multidrug efflux system